MTGKKSYRKILSQVYPKLGRKAQRIADLLLNNPGKVLEESANTVAKYCGCDQATVVRFAQQLGYNGYTELKFAIAREEGGAWQNLNLNHESNRKFDGICGKLLQLHTEALKTTLANACEELCDVLTTKIMLSKRVMLCGCGTSRLASEDLNIKLMRMGINTFCFPDPQMWKTFIGYLDSEDVLILFSNSGETSEIVEIAGIARKKAIYIAAVTGFEGSSLASLADSVFFTSCSGERPIPLGAMASRAAQSVMVDLIAICLSIKNEKQAWDYLGKSYEFTK